MKLRFATSYLSIKEFPEINLKEFTLITGLNGTGKSHLLRAIQTGSVRADIAQEVKTDVRFYDWTNLLPQDQGAFQSETLTNERDQIFEQFSIQTRAQHDTIVSAARNHGVRGAFLANPIKLAELSEDELSQILENQEKASKAHAAIQHAVRAASEAILNHKRVRDFRGQIEKAAQVVRRPVFALTQDELEAIAFPPWGQSDIFQQSFGRLFVAYRELWQANKMKQMEEQESGKKIGALSEAEFVKAHMVAPWIFVNEAFRNAELDFEIDGPPKFSRAKYQPILKKKSNGALVLFNDLSSGEKILMSFALCLYYAQDRRQLTTYPKLLLLDEIDAPLHPSMSRILIRTIQDTLISKYSIHVIATTHSPSTVALAPEDSVYVMRNDLSGLHKTSKSEALNVLTCGVPILSISYDGRRQVFVESKIDADVLDSIYQTLRSQLSSERSLQFVATGSTSRSGTDVNSGCENVRRLVNELSKQGNQSVFGLIDWDGGTNKGNGRIAVLAEGRRDGIENVLLDPLLVAGAIAKIDRAEAQANLNFSQTETYASFRTLEPRRLQELVFLVADRVLESSHTPERVTVKCGYGRGKLQLLVPKAYLEMDDHSLEEQLLSKYPVLNRVSRQRGGALLRYMCDVIADQPEFAPIELVEVFEWLLTRPSHQN